MKKRIIKKLLAFTLSGAMTVASVGCGNTAPAEPATEETAVEEAATEETAEETVEEPVQEEAAEEAEDLVTGENMLSNGDFSAGVDPWMSFCQDGECSLLLTKEGVLDVSINSVGTVAHGVQIYHDGFSLDEGCIYKISFDAYSNIERTGEMRFQINGGD